MFYFNIFYILLSIVLAIDIKTRGKLVINMKFLIVISGPSLRKDPNTGQVHPAGFLLQRLKTTLNTWNSLISLHPDLYIICSGGRGFHNKRPIPSSTIMKKYLVDEGIPHFRILEDMLARTTVENAVNACDIMNQCENNDGLMRVEDNECSEDNYATAFQCWGSVTNVHVITSNFHLERTKLIFDHYINTRMSNSIQTHYIGAPDNLKEDDLVLRIKNERLAIKYFQSKVSTFEEKDHLKSSELTY